MSNGMSACAQGARGNDQFVTPLGKNNKWSLTPFILLRRISRACSGGRIGYVHRLILAFGNRLFGRCGMAYLHRLIFLLLIALPLKSVASYTLTWAFGYPQVNAYPDPSSCVSAGRTLAAQQLARGLADYEQSIIDQGGVPAYNYSNINNWTYCGVIDGWNEPTKYFFSVHYNNTWNVAPGKPPNPACVWINPEWTSFGFKYGWWEHYGFQCEGTPSCSSGQTLSSDGMTCQGGCTTPEISVNGTCVNPTATKEMGGDNCPMLKSNPINVGNGNKYQVETDYTGIGIFPLGFQRYYNSSADVINTRLGHHWRSNFDRSIVVSSDPTVLMIYGHDGKGFAFRQSGGVWAADDDIVGRLEQIAGGWRFTNSQDEVETYDAAGKLSSIASPSGLKLNLAYD